MHSAYNMHVLGVLYTPYIVICIICMFACRNNAEPEVPSFSKIKIR